MAESTEARDRAIEAMAVAINHANPVAHDEDTARIEAESAVDALLARRELLHELLNASKGEHVEGIAGEELPFLLRSAAGQAVAAIVDRWHAAGSPTDPEVLRALLAAVPDPDVTARLSVIEDLARRSWRGR